MSNRQFDTRTETKSSLSRQPVRRREQGHVAETSILPQRDPLPRIISGTGNMLSASAHASDLNQITAGRPSRAGQSMLQLQRQYGNRYVQRVLALARKGAGDVEVAPELEQSIQRERGGGLALDSKVQGQMESSFGADFGGVRVHANTQADTLNQALSARAFTTGQDIFFRQSAYNPGSSSGRELLAHELTHVVQQTGGVRCKLTVGRPGDRYEQEADQMARAVMRQEQHATFTETSQAQVHCQAQDEEEETPIQTRIGNNFIQQQDEDEEEALVQSKTDSDKIQGQVEEEEEESVQTKAECCLMQRQIKKDYGVGTIQLQEAPQLQLLGSNPGCTRAQRQTIHQAIYNARGWLNKAITQMRNTPLSRRVRQSLRRNFGPTYGVPANRRLILGRLRRVYREISTIPIGCAGATNATCARRSCGFSVAGSHRATICSNVTLTPGTDWRYQAGCALHESFHAAFSRFTVDEYSGWHGASGSTPTYPGTGTDPLLNADSYTTLVMDLS